MRRIIAVCFFFLCILSVSFAFADFDESQIPPPIENDKPLLSLRRTKIDRFVTGIRFDLDDENMPVIIIKEKMVNKSERSMLVDSALWIFNNDPYAASGSALEGDFRHYKKDYLGVKFTKTKKGKIKMEFTTKSEIAPGEEEEWETVCKIDNFTDPVYMYFMAEEYMINLEWQNHTLVVIPEDGTVKMLR